MNTQTIDPATREIEREAYQLYWFAKRDELFGRLESAGRFRDEADGLCRLLPPESAERAIEFYRAPGNLVR